MEDLFVNLIMKWQKIKVSYCMAHKFYSFCILIFVRIRNVSFDSIISAYSVTLHAKLTSMGLLKLFEYYCIVYIIEG